VRMICPKCKEEDKQAGAEVKEEIARSLDLSGAKEIKIYRGRGCDACNRTGFYGRTAIYEILTMNEDIRSAILERSRAHQIKALAMKNNMRTLRQAGWQKVLAGITTPSEVLNVTEKDEAAGFIELSPNTELGVQQRRPATQIVSSAVLSAKDEYNARIYPRYKGKVGIRYSIVRQEAHQPNKLITDGVEHSSVTKDISAGGVRFVSGYTLPVGTILQVKIQLSKEERSIDCLAKICRIEDDNLSAMFNLVAYYLDITSADRVRINDYVNMRLRHDEAQRKNETTTQSKEK